MQVNSNASPTACLTSRCGRCTGCDDPAYGLKIYVDKASTEFLAAAKLHSLFWSRINTNEIVTLGTLKPYTCIVHLSKRCVGVIA